MGIANLSVIPTLSYLDTRGKIHQRQSITSRYLQNSYFAGFQQVIQRCSKMSALIRICSKCLPQCASGQNLITVAGWPFPGDRAAACRRQQVAQLSQTLVCKCSTGRGACLSWRGGNDIHDKADEVLGHAPNPEDMILV